MYFGSAPLGANTQKYYTVRKMPISNVFALFFVTAGACTYYWLHPKVRPRWLHLFPYVLLAVAVAILQISDNPNFLGYGAVSLIIFLVMHVAVLFK